MEVPEQCDGCGNFVSETSNEDGVRLCLSCVNINGIHGDEEVVRSECNSAPPPEWERPKPGKVKGIYPDLCKR